MKERKNSIWKNIQFVKENYNLEGNHLEVFKSIITSEFEIVNLTLTDKFQELVKKIEEKSFNFKDHEDLINDLNDFWNKIGRLFEKVKEDLIDFDDSIYRIILNTIRVNFIPLGQMFYENSNRTWYFPEIDYIYYTYFRCLEVIERVTGFKVYKGEPFLKLALLHVNTQNYIKMLPFLGSSLTENRKLGIKAGADNLLESIRIMEAFILQKSYVKVRNELNNHHIFQNIPVNVKDIMDILRSKMDNFPEHALTFLSAKYQFVSLYLLEFYSTEDIFSSLLRLEFLNLLTLFIETLLKSSLNKPNSTIAPLICKFNKVVFGYCDSLNFREIPSYNLSESHSNFYTDLCDFIINLKIDTPTNNKIDITSKDKLKLFQSSVILHKSRNQFHHDLIISSLFKEKSIRNDVPKVFNQLKNPKNYRYILEFILFYLSIILIYNYSVYKK